MARHTYNGVVRGQSAMEYLMTYGWAILIIAVILGVLFSLGVFNPTNYAPKVPAGNCHVFRPNGPGTNFNVNLVGTCSGFLPQYTAQFDGLNSKINVGNASDLNPTNEFTISAWVNFQSFSGDGWVRTIVNKGPEATSPHFWLGYGSNSGNNVWFVEVANATSIYSNNFIDDNVSLHEWYHVVETFNSGALKIYKDGDLIINSAVTVNSIGSGSYGLYIGAYATAPGSSYHEFNGSIANVQLYNASLDANEIQYLYNEGIGGAPIYLSHLVGWWPLNGDAKDYGGNGNDGTPYSLSFNGSWTVGYSAP